MPIYEYRCQECGTTFDKFVRSMSNTTQVECPKCYSRNCQKTISLFGMASADNRTSAVSSFCAPSG